MQVELAVTSPEQSSQHTSPGQGQVVERDRSPRDTRAPSGVAGMFQLNREERVAINQPTSSEANISTQSQTKQFVDESMSAELNQQFTDAGSLQFNVGVDPLIHQESIDMIRQEAVARHHQILQDETRAALQQHQGVLRDDEPCGS